MASLNRFISRLGDRGQPFFKLLKKQEKFRWTEEVQRAFDDLKIFLTTLPVLTALASEEPLLLYIAATTHVVSTALVVEREEPGHVFKIQRPVYFVREVLSESKVQYLQVQKLLYTVLLCSRNLRHYFEAHCISVITSFPLGDILHNQEATGRIAKWVVELGAQAIDFVPRAAIKSQALADFIAEWTEIQAVLPHEKPEHWIMYFDGSMKLEGAGARVLFISPKGEQLKYVLQILWKATNNKAEYEDILHGLRLAASFSIKHLVIYGESFVVVNQVNKDNPQRV